MYSRSNPPRKQCSAGSEPDWRGEAAASGYHAANFIGYSLHRPGERSIYIAYNPYKYPMQIDIPDAPSGKDPCLPCPHNTALFISKRSILIRKRHPYTKNLNSELSGDTKKSSSTLWSYFRGDNPQRPWSCSSCLVSKFKWDVHQPYLLLSALAARTLLCIVCVNGASGLHAVLPLHKMC
jgi:hypothetical protein